MVDLVYGVYMICVSRCFFLLDCGGCLWTSRGIMILTFDPDYSVPLRCLMYCSTTSTASKNRTKYLLLLCWLCANQTAKENSPAGV